MANKSTSTIAHLSEQLRSKDTTIEKVWDELNYSYKTISSLKDQIDRQNVELKILSTEFLKAQTNVVDSVKHSITEDFKHRWQLKCSEEKLKNEIALQTFKEVTLQNFQTAFEVEHQTEMEEMKQNLDSEWQEKYSQLELEFKIGIDELQRQFESKLEELKKEVLTKQKKFTLSKKAFASRVGLQEP